MINEYKLHTLSARTLLIGVTSMVLFLGFQAPNSSADLGSNAYVPSSGEQRLDRILEGDFGCLVSTTRNTAEVRVTGGRGVKIAKKLIAKKAKFNGWRLTNVRRVARSQSLTNYLSAWIFASGTQPPQSDGTGFTSVVSPLIPKSRSTCRTIEVSVLSWPGHAATQVQTKWGMDAKAKYPQNVTLDIRSVDVEPANPM